MIILATGIQWARNYGDIISRAVIRLEDILPRSGKRYTFTFPASDPVESGHVRLLWMPPASAENGWSEAPWEISSSQVVEGSVEPLEPGCAAIDVDKVLDLPSAMREVLPDERFAFPTGLSNAGIHENVWRRCKRSRVAKVGTLHYLGATFGSAGAQLEAILEDTENDLVLRLHAFTSPVSVTMTLVDYRLSDDESALFRALISTAEPIRTNPSGYLTLQ